MWEFQRATLTSRKSTVKTAGDLMHPSGDRMTSPDTRKLRWDTKHHRCAHTNSNVSRFNT